MFDFLLLRTIVKVPYRSDWGVGMWDFIASIGSSIVQNQPFEGLWISLRQTYRSFFIFVDHVPSAILLMYGIEIGGIIVLAVLTWFIKRKVEN